MKGDDSGKCYTCKWRGEVPGSVHSSCHSPTADSIDAMLGPLGQLYSTLGAVGRVPTASFHTAANIAHGSPEKKWFIWPWNFDPTWLIKCPLYEEKEEKR